MEQFNLFNRVTGRREFCDDNEYFRFTLPEERLSPKMDESEIESEIATEKSGHREKKKRKSMSTFLSPATITPEELYDLARWFLTGVSVKDNKFRAKSYRQTFVGSEAVSYLVNNSRAFSRKDAVELGRLLSQGLGLFKGIDGSPDLKDDYLLYRFSEQWTHDNLTELRTSSRLGMVSGLEGISGVSVKTLPLEKVAKAFRCNMKVADHRRGVRSHKNSFVGREAVDFFVGHGLAQDRVAAVDLGRTLAREYHLFEHVRREHEFKDAKHLYRFCFDEDEPIRPLEGIDLDKRILAEIARDFLANVTVKEHQKNMLVFKDSFVASEAVGK